MNIAILATKHQFSNASNTYYFRVNGLTDLYVASPADGLDYLSTENFNISIYFNDTINNSPILNANITVEINGSLYITTIWDNGDGYYNITIVNWQVVGYGAFQVSINASQSDYVNSTVIHNFNLYNATTQSIVQNTLTVIRGVNATFTVYYMWNESTPFSGTNLSVISIDGNFISSWRDNGDGSYDLELNTSNVIGMGATPYSIDFNISSQFNETQIYSVSLYIWNRTSYVINGVDQLVYSVGHSGPIWYIYYGDDVVFNISYIDTDNGGALITGALSNLTLYNGTGTWDNNLTNTDIGGYYFNALSTNSLNIGFYSIDILLNTTLFNITIATIQLEIRACNTTYNIVNYTQYGIGVDPNPYYGVGVGVNITINLNLNNLYTNSILTGASANLTLNGTSYIHTDIDNDGLYIFTDVNISQLTAGQYNYTVKFFLVNYQNETHTVIFNIQLLPVNITLLSPPSTVQIGDDLTLTFKVINGIAGFDIGGLYLTLTIDWGEGGLFISATKSTDGSGEVSFDKKVPLDATELTLSVNFGGISGSYETSSISSLSLNLDVTPPPDKTDDTPPEELDFMMILLIYMLGLMKV